MTRRQQGLSLIETLISLTIGLLLIGSLITVLVNGHHSFRQDLELSRMQESARYALKVLGEDLSMIGFFGDYLTPTGGSGITLNSDCGPGWALSLVNPVALHVNKTGSEAESLYTCIDDEDFVDGTDILAVKRAAGEPADHSTPNAAHDGRMFIRSSPSGGGSIVQYDDSVAVASEFKDWPYLARIYYIRDESIQDSDDGVPTLYRKQLEGLDIVEPDGGIARGIEYFHVEFGIDFEAIDGNTTTSPDGAPNYYTATPSGAELVAAVTAKIYVLARSRDEITGYTNDKTYIMGTASKGPFNDGHYRRVFSSTMHLRNLLSKAFVTHIIEST